MDSELLEIYKRHYGSEPTGPDNLFLQDVNEYIEILRRIINGCDSVE